MPANQIGLVLLVACIVAMLSRKLRLPYSVGLVIAGIGMAVLDRAFKLSVAPDLIYTVLLPPLIFQAALQLKWRPFRDNLLVTLTLGFPGVAVTGAVVAVGMHFAIGWAWLSSALFGALIAATDPVSVIAAFKEMNVEPRLSMLVESECLLNDGATAVVFAMLVAVAHGSGLYATAIVGSLLWMVLGGLAVGVAVAGALLLLASRTEDNLVEITLTTIAAYGSFLTAEYFHMSGVLASLTAGLDWQCRLDGLSLKGRPRARARILGVCRLPRKFNCVHSDRWIRGTRSNGALYLGGRCRHWLGARCQSCRSLSDMLSLCALRSQGKCAVPTRYGLGRSSRSACSRAGADNSQLGG